MVKEERWYPPTVSLLKIACPEVYIRVHFWTRVFAVQKRRYCMESRTSSPKNEHPCSFLGYKFAGANLLLLGTTPVLGRSDRLSIYFSSGTEAAGSISSDVSAVAETRH